MYHINVMKKTQNQKNSNSITQKIKTFIHNNLTRKEINMYGINNNTGGLYSQQNNFISRLNKQATNANKGAEIAHGLIGGINAIKGLQSNSGVERAQSLAQIAKIIAMAN